MAIGKFRCIVLNVTDLELGERFWTAVTGLPLRFSGVGYPTRYSRLGDKEAHSILLQLVAKSMFREKGTYPLGSPKPYLEWAVMTDPFGNKFCLIKDLD
jgi:hypothetical protein